MRIRSSLVHALAPAVALAAALPVLAQEPCACPPPPEPDWKGSLGAGLALTSGNTDTSSFNVSFGALYDPKKKNRVKLDGLYLRSSSEGEATADKTAAAARDEYNVSAKAYVFGELRYYRDAFKEIDYLVSPLAGFGYRFVDSDTLKLSADASLGGHFEKDEGQDSTSDGAVQGGQAFAWKPSPTTTISERLTGLWKVSDFGDALYRFEVGLTTTLSKRLEFKIAYVRDYKTRPPRPELEKGDNSLVSALSFTIG